MPPASTVSSTVKTQELQRPVYSEGESRYVRKLTKVGIVDFSVDGTLYYASSRKIRTSDIQGNQLRQTVYKIRQNLVGILELSLFKIRLRDVQVPVKIFYLMSRH